MTFQNSVHHTSLSSSAEHYPWRRFQMQPCELATRNIHRFLMLNFDQFNYFKEVKIFSSADRQTGMGSEKEETLWVFSCLTVSQCSLPWRKKASYVSLKGSEAWMVLPSCAIGFFETSRYVIFSRPPLWAAQFCHVPRLWLAVTHQEKHLKVVSLPLQNGFGILVIS